MSDLDTKTMSEIPIGGKNMLTNTERIGEARMLIATANVLLNTKVELSSAGAPGRGAFISALEVKGMPWRGALRYAHDICNRFSGLDRSILLDVIRQATNAHDALVGVMQVAPLL